MKEGRRMAEIGQRSGEKRGQIETAKDRTDRDRDREAWNRTLRNWKKCGRGKKDGKRKDS